MTDNAGALVPVDEKTVDFYGDALQGVTVTVTPIDKVIALLNGRYLRLTRSSTF